MNIGILINRLGHNQTTFNCIKSINKISEKNWNNNYTIFFEENYPTIIQPLCPIMNIYDMWSFTGILILTSLHHIKILEKMVLPIKTALYVQDLEWLENYNYVENYNAYHSTNWLIARSGYHANAIYNFCHRKIDLIEPSFDLTNINELYRKNS